MDVGYHFKGGVTELLVVSEQVPFFRFVVGYSSLNKLNTSLKNTRLYSFEKKFSTAYSGFLKKEVFTSSLTTSGFSIL